jgi:hypothetical protein
MLDLLLAGLTIQTWLALLPILFGTGILLLISYIKQNLLCKIDRS